MSKDKVVEEKRKEVLEYLEGIKARVIAYLPKTIIDMSFKIIQ